MTDPARGDAARYSTVAILLHWLIAALILLQIVMAGRMEARTPEAFAVTQLHKSIGISILLLSLARLAWRFTHRPPPEPEALASWERRLAGVVHVGLYAVMILMPLTGWIMVSASRYDVPTLLFGVVPWPHLPGLSGLDAAAKAWWHEAGEIGHDVIIKGGYALIGLHVAGALKHHLLDREAPVLPRMAPGARGGRVFEPWILGVAVAALAVIAFGRLYTPPLPALRPPPPPLPDVADAPAPAAAPAAAPSTAPAAASDASTPAAPTASAKATPWTVQRGSSVGFATAWSGQPIEGRFERWTADIVFSPDDLANSRVTVRIDVASAATGDAQRDASLGGSDWFDAAAHPQAVFTANRFETTGEGRYVARGELALRGVKRPLALPFRLEIDGDRARVRGVTSLDRTIFGVGQGEWTQTDQIPAKVSVTVDVKARRTSP